MADTLRGLVMRALRIPPDPRVPEGEEARVRVFRAAPNFYWYTLARWGLAQLGALAGLVAFLVFVRNIDGPDMPLVRSLIIGAELLSWGAFLVQLPFTYAMVRMDYDLRWYMVTDRSLRIREGLTRIREQTMTFANIQNMTIRQGPLQRLLGIADLEVHTAGGGRKADESSHGSSIGQPMHVGLFRGVDNAEVVRDLIRDRVRHHRDAGLGDPDDVEAEIGTDHPLAHATARPAALDAAEELLHEMRLLRGALPVRSAR